MEMEPENIKTQQADVVSSQQATAAPQAQDGAEEEESLTPIHDFLVEYAGQKTVRAHTPGHKGDENKLDITEIEGADSLYEADFFSKKPGIIAKSEQNASKLFGTVQTLYSCGGSTLAIQAMLTLAKMRSRGKDHVIAGRYSHRAFINSCIMLGLTPNWIYPEKFLSAEIRPEDVEHRITDRTMAVFLTSIDYCGGMCDIGKIAEVCKKHNIPLLVDNAHGAYLKFLAADKHPITLGADMCCDSAHKTLPVLTGGAYLHIGNPKYCEGAKGAMAMFGSSSPSYLILDSLDRCNAELTKNPGRIRELAENIIGLKDAASSYGFALAKSDYLRLTLDCAAIYGSGVKGAKVLKEFGIECEYYDEATCVLMFGWSTTDEDLTTVREVLKAVTPSAFVKYNSEPQPPHIVTSQWISPAKAYFNTRYKLPVKEAIGKICAATVAPCPPGIPLIMPGEMINDSAIKVLEYAGIEEVYVTSV